MPWLFERYSSHVHLFVRNFVDGLFRLIKQLDSKNDHNVVRTTKKNRSISFVVKMNVTYTISLIEIGACSSVWRRSRTAIAIFFTNCICWRSLTGATGWFEFENDSVSELLSFWRVKARTELMICLVWLWNNSINCLDLKFFSVVV